MSVSKVGKKWSVSIYFEGKRYRKRSPDNTHAGAKAYEILLRQKMARGEFLNEAPEPPKPKELLLKEFVPQWMETYVRTNNKPTEQRTKEINMRVHLLPCFGTFKLSGITALEIERYKAEKVKQGLSPKTINNHLMTLIKCLRCANEWDMLVFVPRMKRLPVAPQEPDHLTPLESARLLADRQEPIWHEMILVALRTGMRLGELLGLDWSAVDFQRRLISVRQSIVMGHISSPKSNQIRHIPMVDEVAKALQSRSKPHGFVFPRPDGQAHASYNASTLAITRHCKRVGLRHIGWHTLRHTFASQLVTESISMRAIQGFLGHSTVQMTERYAHLAPVTLHGSIEVLQAAEQRALQKVGHYMDTVEESGAATPK